MSNVEAMYAVYFKKRLSKAKSHFDILRFDIRYSAVRCSGHLKFLQAPPLAWHLTPKSLLIGY
jgi:hypothetical protein